VILRIGLDFDNTIANYNLAFSRVAELLDLKTTTNTKSEVKRELLSREGGDFLWQKVQGLTYGRYIHLAEIHSGLLEFIFHARSLGHQLYIVSHKTEFGHFDESFTPLRAAALTWLQVKRVVGELPTQIKSSEVFFCQTQDEKISKINELNLDVFVDDLEEVFKNQLLSLAVRRILFSANVKVKSEYECFSSWREISQATLGEISVDQIAFTLKNIWPNFAVKDVHEVLGGGNSKIFKVETRDCELALKIYPDLASDARPRRANEWLALSLMDEAKMQTPKPFATDKDLNWSLIEWFNGNSADYTDHVRLKQAVDFTRALLEVSRSIRTNTSYGFATEACLTPIDVEQQILSRLNFFRDIDDSGLQKFLEQVLMPKFNNSVKDARRLLEDGYEIQLSSELWTLSPSDFGLHNSIITSSNDLVFYDFEYFGWDDPVKVTADFCLHPAMRLDLSAQKYWLNEMKSLFAHDFNFELRLRALTPLYVIRWVLIILNEFRSDKLKNRLHAQSTIQIDIQSKQVEQLEKAKSMIENLDRSLF
jgi:hypothetical protein